jgi:hypothetical protein
MYVGVRGVAPTLFRDLRVIRIVIAALEELT